jgi:hypothetical protein
MMAPSHDLIPNVNIMRRRRAIEKSNCFACRNIAMRQHIEMMAVAYADSGAGAAFIAYLRADAERRQIEPSH